MRTLQEYLLAKRQAWREDSAVPTPPRVYEDRTHARRVAYSSDPLLARRNVARSAVPRGPQLSRSPMPEYERTRKEMEGRRTTWTRK